ncbi:MAG: hypothetical protein AAB799_01205, partial [Patescibacteria group bacterium]
RLHSVLKGGVGLNLMAYSLVDPAASLHWRGRSIVTIFVDKKGTSFYLAPSEADGTKLGFSSDEAWVTVIKPKTKALIRDMLHELNETRIRLD